MYSNLFNDTNVSKNYDRKVIMYFNSIGSKPDEVMERALNYAGFKNPKVKKTTYGNFKARKYSYLCDRLELDYMLKKFYNYMHDHNGDILVLKQNKYNIYVLEHVVFD